MTLTRSRQQSYGLPLAAAVALNAQISITADAPGGPLVTMLAGLSEIGPAVVVTPGVRDVAVIVLIQPGPETVSR